MPYNRSCLVIIGVKLRCLLVCLWRRVRLLAVDFLDSAEAEGTDADRSAVEGDLNEAEYDR